MDIIIETQKSGYNQCLAKICLISLQTTWAFFTITLFWAVIAGNIASDEVIICLLIALPATTVFFFCIHIVAVMVASVTHGYIFGKSESTYFLVSDIFFILLICFLYKIMAVPFW